MQQYITTMEKSKINLKYKKIPHNDNAIEIDGKVVLSFDGSSSQTPQSSVVDDPPQTSKQSFTRQFPSSILAFSL